ncbi:hypothetical protein AG1IA_08133 [Rhizoctonia solani AG-1 IA]|uniref:Uncharacterized protein n=1 Tax=Thanatephorus cucumeris (strain AG1-IA) TaxID=983506 RepID=L8WM62_THACA|nr:hypothetical protein AG1IA_08133 [Rhizoctonia solani AG-1 IA]
MAQSPNAVMDSYLETGQLGVFQRKLENLFEPVTDSGSQLFLTANHIIELTTFITLIATAGENQLDRYLYRAGLGTAVRIRTSFLPFIHHLPAHDPHDRTEPLKSVHPARCFLTSKSQ